MTCAGCAAQVEKKKLAVIDGVAESAEEVRV
jgi:copper chaperone CopZ